MWEKQKLTVDHTAVASQATAEPMKEDEEEADEEVNV